MSHLSPAVPTRCPHLYSLLLVAGSPLIMPLVGLDHGLWISLQTLPTDVEITVGRLMSFDDDYDSAVRLAFGYQTRSATPVAFSFATGFAISQEELGPADVFGYGVVAEPGLSFTVSDGFTIDAVVLLGAGAAEIDADSGSGEDGVYTEIGIALRPAYTWEEGFSIGATFGYLARYQEFDINLFGSDLYYDSQGFTGGATFGYRF